MQKYRPFRPTDSAAQARQDKAYARLQQPVAKRPVQPQPCPEPKTTAQDAQNMDHIFNRLYQDRTKAQEIRRQQILHKEKDKYTERELNGPEISERVVPGKVTKELTADYDPDKILEARTTQYEKQRRQELLATTTSEAVVKHITKDMDPEERKAALDAFRKRMAETQEKPSTITENVLVKQMSSNGRDTYSLKKETFNFRPQITKFDPEQLGIPQNKRKTFRSKEPQYFPQSSQAGDFKPRINTNYKVRDYKNEVMMALFSNQ